MRVPRVYHDTLPWLISFSLGVMTAQGATDEDWWIGECKEPFEFLIHDYGFSQPVGTRAGNEFTATYTKGNETVKVPVEPFSPPIVELFYPTPELRNRRFVRTASTRLPRKRHRGDREEDLGGALRRAAAELATKEHEWLST